MLPLAWLFSLFFFFFRCVFAGMWEHLCASLCTCLRRPEVDTVSSLIPSFPSYILRQTLSFELRAPRFSYSTCKLAPGILALVCRVLKLQENCYVCQAFMWVLKIWTAILMVAHLIIYTLSHLASPCCILVTCYCYSLVVFYLLVLPMFL